MSSAEVQIIGAGIGGLTLAIALQSKGVKSTVYERASEISAVGAGIILPPNAMEIFRALGLSEAIRMQGHNVERYSIRSKLGKVFNTISTTSKGKKPAVALVRPKLHHILSESLNDDTIKLGRQLESIDEVAKRIHFVGGETSQYYTLVGADGIRSQVRQQTLGDSALRDAKQYCFRGVVTAKNLDALESEFFELWGQGARFGFVCVAKDTFYWYATFSTKAYRFDEEELLPKLVSFFADWWWPVGTLLKQQCGSNIISTPLFDRIPDSRWHNDNGVVLLGDAIHATTPNLGQGAAMAIESAYTLSDEIANNIISPDFNLYQSNRYKRTTVINKQSWMIGVVANVQSKWGCYLRDRVMTLTTDNMATNQYHNMVTWLPDSLHK